MGNFWRWLNLKRLWRKIVSGIHAVLAGGSKSDVYSVPFTRGVSGSTEGVAEGFYIDFGAFTGNKTLAGGRTIVAYFDNAVLTELAVLGNQTGTWWTSVTVNGTTYTRASSTTPAGTFDGTYTYWDWNTTLTTWPASGEIYII
jgi:hypothetical protein